MIWIAFGWLVGTVLAVIINITAQLPFTLGVLVGFVCSIGGMFCGGMWESRR